MNPRPLAVVVAVSSLALLQSHATSTESTSRSPAQKADYEMTVDARQTPRSISGTLTGAALRYDGWPSVNGTVNFGFNWGAIHAGSHVYVSASEVDNAGNRFNGAATYTVQNIVVKEGRVEFRVKIDWGSPIRISTDILTVDP
ncbi:hypothetical protein JGU66_19065 [Myxococcaceae bacterium JPH2]|nr:hypothetical protein [Myxococcaceae bacterium JPH2]